MWQIFISKCLLHHLHPSSLMDTLVDARTVSTFLSLHPQQEERRQLLLEVRLKDLQGKAQPSPTSRPTSCLHSDQHQRTLPLVGLLVRHGPSLHPPLRYCGLHRHSTCSVRLHTWWLMVPSKSLLNSSTNSMDSSKMTTASLSSTLSSPE